MSKNQVIKKYIDFFDGFVESHFIFENGYYIFNNLVFKKLVYENHLSLFLNQLKKYYYKNKLFYIERNGMSFNQFTTILRQICKKNNIDTKKIIKYENSKYCPEYHIFL